MWRTALAQEERCLNLDDNVGDSIRAAILITDIWDWYIVWPIDVD